MILQHSVMFAVMQIHGIMKAKINKNSVMIT